MTNEELLLIISDLNERQRQALEQYLEYLKPEDNEVACIQDKKMDIYNKYSTTIAYLIAKVEVCKHDLPRQVTGMIETIFRILSAASATEEQGRELSLYDVVIKYEECLINLLYLMLVDYYVREIKKYRKTLKKFKYQSIELEEGILFMEKVNNKLKELRGLHKENKRLFKNIYNINSLKFMMLMDKFNFLNRTYDEDLNIGIVADDKLPDLALAFNIAEETVGVCEENYSRVINNGYNSTYIKRFLCIIPTLASVILAGLGVAMIIL